MKLFDKVYFLFIFLACSLLFCFPQLKGKILSQFDNVQWQYAAHEGKAYHDSTGKDVLWSNSMFGGMPTYTTYVAATNTNYPSYFQIAIQKIGKPAYFFFIFMLGFYVLMMVLGASNWLSIIGAIAYSFATFNVIIVSAGHETQALSIGYLPLALSGMILIYREKWLYGAALLSTSMALMVGNNHFQVIFYTFLVFLCFTLYQLVIAVKDNKLKTFFFASVLSVLSGCLGFGPSITSVLVTKEYASSTIRGGKSHLSIHDKKSIGGLDKETAFKWSAGKAETFCTMIPYLFGGGSFEPLENAPKTAEVLVSKDQPFPIYWGPQPLVLGPVYSGAAICFLFVLGFFVLRNNQKWWFLAASVLGTILSWGKNFSEFNYFLFDHLPFFNMFRAVTMAKFIPQLFFPLLGILALHELILRKSERQYLVKVVAITGGSLVVLCLLVGTITPHLLSLTNANDAGMQEKLLTALREDRAALALHSALRSALFIALAAAAIIAFLNDKIKLNVFIAAIGCIIIVDLLPIAMNYLNENNYMDESDYASQFEPRDVDKEILKDKDPYFRVLDLTVNPFSSAKASYFHKSIGGNSAALMEKYNDLVQTEMINGFNASVINMLNARYFILANGQSNPQLVTNKKACGNAWFVSEVKWADNEDQVIAAMKSTHLGDTATMPDAFDPLKTAIADTSYRKDLQPYKFAKDSNSSVKLDQYGLDDISFMSSNANNGLAVFSDIYYSKGWKAFIDGKETQIFKVNYVLRALKVPAGNHKIEFHFHPDTFYNSQPYSLASSILVMLLCAAALLYGFDESFPGKLKLPFAEGK